MLRVEKHFGGFTSMDFFKLYSPPKGRTPPSDISLFYRGRPLYVKAVFAHDRYLFRLPLNLREKMITGNMYADFVFAGEEKKRLGVLTPEALILSDRYD